jgi:TRAP-type C4-dicarboxylate transport system permease small subunit
MALKIGLTDKQQAVLMFFAFLLATWTPILTMWTNNGAPTDKASIVVLFASLLVSFMAASLAFLKEILGINQPQATQATQTQPKTPAQAAKIPAQCFSLLRRSIWLHFSR